MQEGTSKPDLCRCCYHYTIISSKEVIILICRSVWQEEETAVGSPDLWLVGFHQQEQEQEGGPRPDTHHSPGSHPTPEHLHIFILGHPAALQQSSCTTHCFSPHRETSLLNQASLYWCVMFTIKCIKCACSIRFNRPPGALYVASDSTGPPGVAVASHSTGHQVQL